jgi:hypothetical protein
MAGVEPRDARGARLLQPVHRSGTQVGCPAIQVGGDLLGEVLFGVHSLIPLAESISAKARTAREQ